MSFLRLEDEVGLANIIVNLVAAERYKATLRAEPFVLVSGRLQQQDGVTNVLAERLAPLRLPRELILPAAHDFR